jgi:copper transport protein
MTPERGAGGRVARLALLVLLLLALAVPATASAHAVLLGADPAPGARLADPPGAMTLRFSEPVQTLSDGDVAVLDASGASVAARGGPGDGRVLSVPLRPGLPEGTYTVRYHVLSADSHGVRGVHVFGVGAGPLGAAAGAPARGPSETGPWAVSARLLELVALGGLAGLLGFRWLVWRPALRAGGRGDPAARAGAEAWGRDGFWAAFGALAVLAVLAEAYLLVVKGAGALGTGVAGALGDPAGLGEVLAETRFGAFVRARAALLLALLALAGWELRSEVRRGRAPRPGAAVAMAGLLGGLLLSLSVQGHASQAPLAALSVAADAAHLAAVSVWVGGLAAAAAVLWRLPRRLAGGAGAALASAALVRFSGVAFAAVAAALVTGVARSAGQLDDPAQLWDTGYGLSIVIKLLLLCPIALLALVNRKTATSLRHASRPSSRALRAVGRRAGLELALTLAVVVVASVLVAQVPGRV